MLPPGLFDGGHTGNLSAANRYFFEFIVTDKAQARRGGGEGVGVLKDEELKLEEIEASHTVIR